jgi:hypothetical protein
VTAKPVTAAPEPAKPAAAPAPDWLASLGTRASAGPMAAASLAAASLAAASVAAAPAAAPDSEQRRQRRRSALYLGVPFLLLITVWATAIAIGDMSLSSFETEVSVALLVAAVCLGGAALTLYVFGRAALADRVASPERRSILLHGVGSVAILVWIAWTQAIAEGYHATVSSVLDNVALGRGPPNTIALIAAVGLMIAASATVSSPEYRWLRFAWYSGMLLLGLIYFLSHISFLLERHDYWVTTGLNVYGGLALMLLTAIVIGIEWRGGKARR